jgi:hypothetical protein
MNLTFDKKCLICSTSDKLNTKISVIVDGQTHEVALCEEHEDTTPKKAREIIASKIQGFKDLTEKMRQEYGIEMSSATVSAGGIALPQKLVEETDENEEEVSQESETQTINEIIPDAVVPVKAKVKFVKANRTPKPVSAVPKVINAPSGTVQGGRNGTANIESRASLDVSSEVSAVLNKAKAKGLVAESVIVPKTQAVKDQIVPGRCGRPMKLPHVIQDSFGGKTLIQVVDTGGDQTIQKRFKESADPQNGHTYSNKDGYDVSECTLCRGSGVTINDEQCPKCSGIGLLNR